VKSINTWWTRIPGERFWLGGIGSDDKGNALAAPRGPRHALIMHVKRGDVVFHCDLALRAIVAWSAVRGRVHETRLVWSMPSDGMMQRSTTPRLLDSWVIGLEQATPLDSSVPFDQIARIQSERFPALRAFEDQVGPLEYPFAMEDPLDTYLLPGHVFKLPALFVDWFPPLARVAAQMNGSALARARAGGRVPTRAQVLAQSPEPGVVPATA